MLAAFAEKHGISYPLLADEGSGAIARLGLLNEQVAEQHAAFGIPPSDRPRGVAYPGAFLLDEHGVVREKRFIANYRERETAEAILERGFGVEGQEHGPTVQASGPGLSVTAHLDAETYRVAQRRWLSLHVRIAPGLHVYGEPIAAGYTPLTVEVAPIEGLLAGPLAGPQPRPFRVEGLDEQFVVYEGQPVFALPLTFTKKPGDLTLAVTVRYQACSADDCLPPAALTLKLLLRAENLVDLDR